MQTGTATDEEGIPDGWQGLDAGPKSRELFKKTVLASKTILWNGPPGVFEFPKFAGGSTSLLDAAIEAAKNGSTVIVGGGDTATVVAQHGAEDKLSHVSTGGGASLELLEGKVRALICYEYGLGTDVCVRPSLVSLLSVISKLLEHGLCEACRN